MNRPRNGLIVLCLLLSASFASAREWNVMSGNYKLAGTLVAFDDQQIVIKLEGNKKLHGHELVAINRDDLTDQDQTYLAEVAEQGAGDSEAAQTWTMKSGLQVVGRVVDFAKRDVTVQRRRGKIYANDKTYENLPEIYQRILLRVVEHFEGMPVEDKRSLQQWILTLKGQPRTYTVEGVILELKNGDEYGVPFFLFSEKDLAVLQPHWEKWVAAQDSDEQQQQHALYLQSEAEAYQQSLNQQLQVQNQIAIAQLQLMAVATGAVDLWEVYLRPGPGVIGYPITVIVPALNSQVAAAEALQRNPGYIVGPIRKASGF